MEAINPSYTQQDYSAARVAQDVHLSNDSSGGDVTSTRGNVVLNDSLADKVHACLSACLNHSKVESVLAERGDVKISKNSLVSGAVIAHQQVCIDESRVGSVVAQGRSAEIKHGSCVTGSVIANHHVSVSASDVDGAVRAHNYGVRIRERSTVGAVTASTHAEVLSSQVLGSVESQYSNAVVKNAIVQGAVKAARGAVIESSTVKGDVASNGVRAIVRSSQCGNVSSEGIPQLLESELESLTVYVDPRRPILIDLGGSTLRGRLVVRKSLVESKPLQARSYGCYELHSDIDSSSGMIQGAAFRCGRDSFEVSGSVNEEIMRQIKGYCDDRTVGLVNDVPMQYVDGELTVYDPSAAKVVVVAGAILGGIDCDFTTDIDSSQAAIS